MFSKFVRPQKLMIATLALITTTIITPGSAGAQQSGGVDFRISPYLWMLSMDGTTAALGEDADVDASFGDILDFLNFALSVNMEWSTGKWFFVLDPMYANLETDFAVPSPPAPAPLAGKIEIDLIIADAMIGYYFKDNFGVYTGVRYYDQDITIVPSGMAPSIPLGDDWTDFPIGLRGFGKIGDKWSFVAEGDVAVGGDSDSAFYVQALFLRHFGENKHLDLGWRYYDVDYESGSGLTRFKWDVAHSGPIVGFSWEF